MPTIRKTPTGTWRVEVRIKGYPPQRKTLRTKPQAKRWAQQVEDSIRMGEYTQSGSVNMSDLLSRYLREIVPLKKSRKFHLSNIRNLDKAMGHILASDVTAQNVVDYVSMRMQTVSSSTIRKEVNTLNHIFKTGIALWSVQAINPVPTAKDILSITKALSESRPRNRRLYDGEEERLYMALSDSVEPLLVAMLTIHTARRLKEILAINQRVLTQRKGRYYLRVVDNKTDHPITVPLSEKATELLDGFKGFTVRSDSVSQSFNRAVKRAGLVDLRLTDLRHEALSRLFERGFSVPEVMAISGHKSPDVLLKVYSQVQADKLSEKLSRNTT